MNVLKVRNLLGQKLLHTISRPILDKPCCYSNTVMRLPLREKIQNAINRAINDSQCWNDYGGIDGARIVGGRRRSRKKKNKKNGQKKKKSGSLESLKARVSPAGVRKNAGQENIPLIETDSGANGDTPKENGDISIIQKMKVAVSPKSSPKLSRPKPSVLDLEEPSTVQNNDAIDQEHKEVIAQQPEEITNQEPTGQVCENQTTEESNKQEDEEKDLNEGFQELINDLCDAAKQNTEVKTQEWDNTSFDSKEDDIDLNDVVKHDVTEVKSNIETQPATTMVKSEKSPLISKNSEGSGDEGVRGHSGGHSERNVKDEASMICCTIL